MLDRESEKAAKASEKDAQKQAKEVAKAARVAERKAESAVKRAALEARVQARKDEKSQSLDAAGKEISSDLLGGKYVKFFENGYVSVSSWGGGNPERLVDVTTNADVAKKTGLGRAVAGVLTAGVNYGAASNMRGDIYISIVTDKTTHMIHDPLPSESKVKAARKIEATGKGLLARLSQSAKSMDSKDHAPADIAEQLSKLVELHKAGLLTEDEFTNAKAKIIG